MIDHGLVCRRSLTSVLGNLWIVLALAAFGFGQNAGAPTPPQAPDKEQTAAQGSKPVDHAVEAPPPTPVRLIDLESLGFRRLSQLRSRDGSYHLTFNFFDENHLLLTFEGSEMVKRHRSCPRTHDDRMVHAAVVDVKTGEVLHKADWYLHDRRPYVWPLASGKMLLRRGDSLLALDEDLTEQTVLDHAELFWADVTPDGTQIVAGVIADQSAATKNVDGGRTASLKYEARLLDAQTFGVLGAIPLERPIPLKMASNGYADVVLKSGWTWMVRFGARGQARRPITRVHSSCIPDIQASGDKTLLVGRCTTAQDRYVMSSFSTDGHFLWRHRWLEMLNSPFITRSATGARFALATVKISKEERPLAADDEEASREVRHQNIEVFNAATGTSVISLETQPAVSVGGNIALSPKGTTLAALRDARVEIYSLPAMAQDEVAKLTAVRAGTPELTPPKATADPDEDAELIADDDFSPKQLEKLAVLVAPPPAGSGDIPKQAPANLSTASTGDAANSPELVIHSRAAAVTVDVLVTDSKGHPVPGLKAEDFTVIEDGSPQKVNYFKEHSVIDTHVTPAPTYKHPANIFSNVSDTTQPDSATLILLDMLNSQPLDQSRARDALTKYIKTKPPNESFALCVLDRSLHLVRGFTVDENELLMAMNDKRARSTSPLISQLDVASLKFIRSATQKLDSPSDIARSFAISMAGLERSIQDEQMSQNDMRTYMTIGAFEELAGYMAGVPGRKKVLWLSAAFPLGQFPAQGGLDAGPFHAQRNFIPLISKTMNLLASAHVSIYPVDIRGIETNSIADAGEERPFSQDLPNTPLTSPTGTGQMAVTGGSGIDANASANTRNLANDHIVSPDGFIGRAMEDSTRRNSEHSAMDFVAEQTGGKAFYGSNDVSQAVRTVVEQGTDYYTVSYSPSNRKYDGRFRKIRVKVNGKGLRIAHRSGYYAEDPNHPTEKSDEVMRNLNMAGMLHGAPESRQIPFETRIVPVGEPKTVNAKEAGIQREGKNAPTTVKLQRYRIDFAIPAASLRFDSRPEGKFHGSFRILANSYSSDGQGILQASTTAVADLKPENYRSVLSEGLRLHQEFDVPTDAGYLRLGVADMSTSYIGTLELPLPIAVPKNDPSVHREGSLPPVEPD
jgi:VWFA-related protein